MITIVQRKWGYAQLLQYNIGVEWGWGGEWAGECIQYVLSWHLKARQLGTTIWTGTLYF